MPTIALTRGCEAIVGDEDTDLCALTWFVDRTGYARRNVRVSGQHTTLLLHRIVLERTLGRALIAGELCDHINGQRLDNRRENLRVVSPLENARNKGRSRTNSSGVKGVSWNTAKGKWVAQICVDYHKITLCITDDRAEAEAAYNAAAEQYFGEYRRGNG